MRKLFYLTLSLILLFLIPAEFVLAAITSVTTNAPATGSTSVTLSGTSVLTDNVNEAYDVRGFNFGTASAAAGNYTSSSTVTGTFTGGATFTHATTSLSKGTAYYFRAYAASSTVNSIVYGSEVKILTGVDDPSNVQSLSFEDRIKISWSKGTGAGNTLVRYQKDGGSPNSTSTGTQAYLDNGAEVTLTNLSPETTYYFSVWSSTTAAGLSTTSGSYIQRTAATTAVSSGGTITRVAPTTYLDSIVINGGAKTTKTREITLSLKAGNVSLMTISNDNLFLGPLENYSTTKSWTLTEGDGVKTVYVKFVSHDGLNSDIISDTITLTTPTPTVPAVPATPAIPATPATPAEPETKTPAVPAVPATPATPAAPAEKPISQMTKEELAAKITEIMNQIKELQGQAIELRAGKITRCIISTFNRNLRRGMLGDDIKCLQIILNSDSDTKITDSGDGSLGNETNFFGSLTRAAVIKFQEKYASEVLTSSGLKKGTGLVYPATRAKLNELLGK